MPRTSADPVSDPDLSPVRDAELARLPVFPLPNVVLFPGAHLPLHLFEPRYREMIEHCVTVGPMALAVAMFEPGWEGDYEGRPSLRPIAGVGRIERRERRPDGRWDILLRGESRVRLHELPAEGHRFRLSRAERLPDLEAVALEPIRTQALMLVSTLATLARRQEPTFELGVPLTGPPGPLADALADRLIADPELRQAVLEAQDVGVRFARLQDGLADLLARIGGSGPGELH